MSTGAALPQQLLFSRTTSFEIPLTHLVEFTQATRRSIRVQRAHDKLRLRIPLVLYVPGWWNTPSDASSQAIVSALITKHSSVLLLDTRLSFCRGYIAAVSNIAPLSHLLFSFIENLHQNGYPISSIHLIGFSLGAHVAGMTGKLVRNKLNATLGRITALDPAKPCFASTEYRLEKRDADFVQVIHSSTGVLGLEEPLGHADVYVNGVAGKHPECSHKSISLECDHSQAWKLFSASVINKKTLLGRRCASWDELLRNQCTGNQTVLGYSCSSDEQGIFLYQSKDTKKPAVRELQVYNPFDFIKWPFNWTG